MVNECSLNRQHAKYQQNAHEEAHCCTDPKSTTTENKIIEKEHEKNKNTHKFMAE
jgi:hypothetical protein